MKKCVLLSKNDTEKVAIVSTCASGLVSGVLEMVQLILETDLEPEFDLNLLRRYCIDYFTSGKQFSLYFKAGAMDVPEVIFKAETIEIFEP